jgi:2-methylcitrate dehydratase
MVLTPNKGVTGALIDDLEASGLHTPFARMSADVVQEAKYRLFDCLLATLGGVVGTGRDEVARIQEAIGTSPGGLSAGQTVRPMYPVGTETSLESAAFLNGFLIRQADWGDSFYVRGLLRGHPSDNVAAVLALCDAPDVPGTLVLEMVDLGYHLYASLNEASPGLADASWDYTSTLALTVPVLAAVRYGVDVDRLNEAVRLSASRGLVMGQVRAGDITNWKSGASGYALASGLWSYRMSAALRAPGSMMTGPRGWDGVVAPMEMPLRRVDESERAMYADLSVKTYPCFQIAQAAVACAVALSQELSGRIGDVEHVRVVLGARNENIANRPGRPAYPETHGAADHHVPYCVATGLVHGALSPRHYEHEFLDNADTKRVVARTSVHAFSADDPDSGAEACRIDVTLSGGGTLSHVLSGPEGAFPAYSTPERLAHLKAILAQKRRMAEIALNRDLGQLDEVVQSIDARSGRDLVDSLHEALQGV